MCAGYHAGEPCEKEHSTCGGRNELCIGRGPAWEADDHGFKSNSIIAGRQFERARSLFGDEDRPALDVTGARLLSLAACPCLPGRHLQLCLR